MAQFLNPFSGRQFLDANGNPYSGAKLFTYVAGTSTKVTTTKDKAGASNHKNPIILNARGEPADDAGASMPIWQSSDVDIKLVLAPADDTDPPTSPISTWDDLSGVNDAIDLTASQWVTGTTPTYVSATEFSVAGDQRTTYDVGRRVWTVNSGGNRFGTINSVSYTTVTVVSVTVDSGSFDSGMSTVYYSLLSGSNHAVPDGALFHFTLANTHSGAEVHSGAESHSGRETYSNSFDESKGANISSAATTDIGSASGNFVHVTGTTTITSFGTSQAGTRRVVTFDGALTLTHNATSLVLPDGVNIRTVAGDTGVFISEGSGNWRCVSWQSTTSKIDVQTFTSNGTWTKPVGFSPNAEVKIQAWAGGGGGAGGGLPDGTYPSGGGGGGAYFERITLLSALGSTETATVGTGGAGGAETVSGSDGNNSTFGSLATAYGGKGGLNSGVGGAGSSPIGSGLGGLGGSGASGSNSPTLWDGGGGGGNGFDGGKSVFGGGGGAGEDGTGGTSLLGGSGGNGSANGSSPGGGGGGANAAGAGGNGGDGKIIITVRQ